MSTYPDLQVTRVPGYRDYSPAVNDQRIVSSVHLASGCGQREAGYLKERLAEGLFHEIASRGLVPACRAGFRFGGTLDFNQTAHVACWARKPEGLAEMLLVEFVKGRGRPPVDLLIGDTMLVAKPLNLSDLLDSE